MRRWELPTARTEWDLSSSDIRSWEETNNFGRFRREVEDGWLKKKEKKTTFLWLFSSWERLAEDAAATCRRQKVKLFDDV